MLGKMSKIEVDGETYPLSFTINVLEEIQERYGDYTKFTEKLSPKESEEGNDPINIQSLIMFFELCINEGIDIENEKAEIKRNFLSHKQVGRIITKLGFGEAKTKLKDLIVSSSPESKNTQATQNQS